MIVFVDTETGGLDPTRHALIEVAWATLDNPEPRSMILPHDDRAVSYEAAQVNRYDERGLGDPRRWATQGEITDFFRLLPGATLCAAHPSFDAGFLNTYHMGSPFAQPIWNYRMLDIASMFVARYPAAFRVGEDGLPGLRHIVEWINEAETEVVEERKQQQVDCDTCSRIQATLIPPPDHTAAGDVRALIGVWDWMFSVYDGRPGGW